ncbi:phosphoglycerate mutase [Streptomyces sp. NBRC 14336]|uniref:histidine phosphatase family protein n=1 Tax=Streptomyces sp. NBRC 14336 TaxID=3030992 RepID=UPI0024A2BB25|nr:histidine phosphatase family protein [Streptomyces sp. NBRC 14336]WBO75713.1 histidine phosphatase family protein [Streptomyces sp. SBE_14.2]GLW49479.1 phosphoglycerate mutase [Streptomyces sp. NBRC 14336]
MTIRLTLLCAALPTARDARFGGDTPLDEKALEQARRVAGSLPAAADAVLAAPSQRCRQTAQIVGREGAVTVEPALKGMDMGNWHGLTPDEVAANDAAGLASWMSDPEAAPHGGESVAQLCRRIAAWLDSLPDDTGRALAVVEQDVARAALLHAIGAPAQSFWRIDIPPLSFFQLTSRSGRWNLRIAAAGGGRARS